MYICRVFFFIISNPCHYVDIVLSVDYVLFRVFMCVFVLLESVIVKKMIDVPGTCVCCIFPISDRFLQSQLCFT